MIVNATAYTAVDQAESNKKLAFAVNQHAVGRVADYCAKNDVPLLHVSTDYVFDGLGQQPYVETDEPNPSGIYGASKLAGERAIADSGCWYVILRTAWVFSEYGQNFLKTMLRLGSERDSLAIVSDQVGCPTYAGDLAFALLTILKSIENGTCSWGLYHYAGDSAVSWYEFASAIFCASQGRRTGGAGACNGNSNRGIPYPSSPPRVVRSGQFAFHERLWASCTLTGREASRPVFGR